MKRILALICLCATPALAQELAPAISPTPPSAPTAPEVADEQPPLQAKSTLGSRDTLRETDAEYQACLSELDRYDVTYSEVEPIIVADDPDCGILRPIQVTEIAQGIAIEPAATLRCETAASLARWTHDFVLPAGNRLKNRGALAALENGSGYICRRRNNASDGKLSEHGVGNAFDILGFRFDDGSRISIQPREADGTLEEAFQDAVRASACLEFSTVLGPGSNASHADHLHLDIISRKTGSRLCEQGGVTPE
jgi:hypothetical protein